LGVAGRDAETGPVAVPHSAQNLAPGFRLALQLAHECDIGLPQESQNLAPARTADWQFEHATVSTGAAGAGA
jgi:hypothetical protein